MPLQQRRISYFLGAVLCFASILGGCGEEQETETPLTTAPTAQDVVSHYAQLVFVSYKDALAKAEQLDAAIIQFVDNPTESSLEFAKRAWLDARVPYGQTEAYRFYDGPIDNEENGGPEGQLNAWPMDENYIDDVDGDTRAGIINNPEEYPSLSPEDLAGLNGGAEEKEENVATGFHAIEFLLWGQDNNTDGPGNRALSDYTTALHADRRGIYLKSASKLLLSDLMLLVDAWRDGEENFRKTFVAQDTTVSLASMISALGKLSKGELAGERMDTALTSKDQEDEHSCFSDNTHVDILMNHKGIENVYYGRYGTLDGPGIDALLQAEDGDLATQVATLLATSNQAINAIPVPFDQAIVDDASEGGRDWVDTAIVALRAQGDAFVSVASALGLGNISIELE